MTGKDSTAAEAPRWRVEVEVMPKTGVNDPEGESIRSGLVSLGHHHVTGVRAGRLFLIELSAADETEARSAVATMCGQLLANPVIQSWEIVRATEIERVT